MLQIKSQERFPSLQPRNAATPSKIESQRHYGPLNTKITKIRDRPISESKRECGTPARNYVIVSLKVLIITPNLFPKIKQNWRLETAHNRTCNKNY